MQQANVTLYSMLKEKASCPIAGYEDIHPLNAHSQEDIQIDILEWLQINDELTDTGESDQRFLSKRSIQEIEKIDWKLQDFLKEQDVEFILHANTNDAIRRILKCLRNAKQSAKDDASHIYSKNVKAMREYILNHFAEKISAKEVAKAVFLSASYANARFTEECGITIFEYTTALQSGVDVKTVSTMLGHSSAGFTLNVYTHSTSRMQQEAARTVGKVMPKMLER